MKSRVPDEEALYARWLERGARSGLWLLIGCFAVYVLELFEPHVPLHELPALWSQPVAHYRAATGAPAGWDWLLHLGKGDYLTFLGIAVLGLVSAVCYARIVPALAARGERLRAWLAVAQVLVLLAAASGLLVTGH